MGEGADGLVDRALTERVIGGFYAVYSVLGFGFLEAVYENALIVELGTVGLQVMQQPLVDVRYRGLPVGQYRPDLVVDDRLLIEVKTVAALGPAHDAQLLNYLRATRIPLGLLLNFGPRPQFRRKINSRR